MFDRRRRTAVLAAMSTTIALSAVGIVVAVSAHAAVGCRVTYAVTAQWPGGFTANVTLDNLGDPVNGWAVRWTFGAGQTVTEGWSASYAQSGTQVTASNAAWNASLATGASTSFGFNGAWNNASNPVPTGFTLNNVACTGTTPPTTTTRPPTTTTSTPPPPPRRRHRLRPPPPGHRAGRLGHAERRHHRRR